MCGQVLVEVLFIHFNPRKLVCVLLRVDNSEMCVCVCVCVTLVWLQESHYPQGSI